MANNNQAQQFLQQVYQSVWEPYNADQLSQFYRKDFQAHSMGSSFCFEQFQQLLNQNHLHLGYMKTHFHQTIAQGKDKFTSWFTTAHYNANHTLAYRLGTMSQYTIKDDKISRVDFMWDKPIALIIHPRSDTQTQTTPSLTQREWQCFFYLIQGHSAKQIARQLAVSFRTIETHVENIKQKLNVQSSRQLIDYAIAQGYLTIAPLLTTQLENKTV